MKKNFLVFIVLVSLFIPGCLFTEIIYVPHGQAVRLRQSIKDVDVWIMTEDGKIVEGKMDLPNGWYCMPYDQEVEAQ